MKRRPPDPAWVILTDKYEADHAQRIVEAAQVEMAPVPGIGERQEIEQSDLELPVEPTAAAEEPGSPVPAPAATSATGLPADASSAGLYERSLELLEQGRLPEAEAGLTRFLAANPDSDLADNAQFWLAEGALRRGDVASALAGFRAVVAPTTTNNAKTATQTAALPIQRLLFIMCLQGEIGTYGH